MTRPRDRLGTPDSWLDLKGTAQRESRPRVTCPVIPFRCPREEARWTPGLGWAPQAAGQVLWNKAGRFPWLARAGVTREECFLGVQPLSRPSSQICLSASPKRAVLGVFIRRLSQSQSFFESQVTWTVTSVEGVPGRPSQRAGHGLGTSPTPFCGFASPLPIEGLPARNLLIVPYTHTLQSSLCRLRGGYSEQQPSRARFIWGQTSLSCGVGELPDLCFHLLGMGTMMSTQNTAGPSRCHCSVT